MSHRTIKIDVDEIREEKLEQLDAELATFAMWKILESLVDDGVDIGYVGKELLARREAIINAYS